METLQSEAIIRIISEYPITYPHDKDVIRAFKIMFNKWNKQKGDYVEDLLGYTCILRKDETLMIFRHPGGVYYFTHPIFG